MMMMIIIIFIIIILLIAVNQSQVTDQECVWREKA